ncbi:MAG: SDR family oxidoreductase [Gracilibacteraceae bacterium]|jgi:NAD(P)-dependent dehydrogenase (short-subunit alcohol dehydrogenase family)|nr:SDR family oxidoreductase [Gracilibacteraceae bacterium]
MKYALVTGATSGIGLAIAEALLQDGCFVFLNYAHDAARVGNVRAQLAEYGERMGFIRADLAEYAGADAVAAALPAAGLTYLVLNVGLTDRTAFGAVTAENWERVMRANVNVPFFLIQGLYKAELFAPGASVLCVSSLLASVPHSVSVSYGVSKAALSALSGNLVKFLAPAGIRINAVEPGFVDTSWQKEKPPDQRARIEARTALGRLAEPAEVAAVCLAALKSTYLTGAVIPISGGYGLK